MADAPIIAKGRTFIAEHHREQLCLGDVARAAKLSTYYFCKVFKKATGLGFKGYLSRARIESVKQMLFNAHLRVSEAGFAAGFQSLSQFNRVFRRVAGETPSRYRERLHRATGPSAHRSQIWFASPDTLRGGRTLDWADRIASAHGQFPVRHHTA